MFLAEWNICFEQNWKHLLLWKTGGKLGSITFEYEFNHWSRKALSCIFESCPLGESFWKEFEINKNYDNTIRWHNVMLFEITHVDLRGQIGIKYCWVLSMNVEHFLFQSHHQGLLVLIGRQVVIAALIVISIMEIVIVTMIAKMDWNVDQTIVHLNILLVMTVAICQNVHQ